MIDDTPARGEKMTSIGRSSLRRIISAFWGLIGFLVFFYVFGGKIDMTAQFSHWPTYAHATLSVFLIGPGLLLIFVLVTLTNFMDMNDEAALMIFALCNIIGWVALVEGIMLILRGVNFFRSKKPEKHEPDITK